MVAEEQGLMSRNALLAFNFLVAFCFTAAVHAAIIHESATLGTTGIDFPILGLDYDQFFGSRFSVAEPVQVEMIGGHIKAFHRPLFAAIVSLASPTAFPSGSPFDSTTMATTLIDAPLVSADVLAPLSVRLNPGDYALIFGAGLFGATINGGGIADNNIDIPGHASYFVWGDSSAHPNVFGWRNYNYSGPNRGGLRFVVTGSVIPEPSALALLMMALALTVGRRWRR